MFTGIIDNLGEFIESRAGKYWFSLPEGYESEMKIGDSVSVNGACLTAVEVDRIDRKFLVDVSTETRNRTNIGLLKPGDSVNLELPMKVGEFGQRLGGHIVQGHVDTMGKVSQIDKRRDEYVMRLATSREYGKFLVDKGAIAVDGISLTPYQVQGGSFVVSVIPHTYNNTTIQFARGGTKVNLEFDILAKYVNKSVDKF